MKKLSELLTAIGFIVEEGDDLDGIVSGISCHSQEVAENNLFVAIPCDDVAKHIKEAYESGAKFFVVEEDCLKTAENLSDDIYIFVSTNARQTLSLLAAAFYKNTPKYLAAVTGTNGKSSVVSLLRQIWQSSGVEAASLGTVGLELSSGFDQNIALPPLTSLDPLTFFKTLSYLQGEKIKALSFEASSHGLKQYRMDGAPLSVAAFTNLTLEHLDYHQTMEDYFAAKARLFSEVLPQGKTAVINLDTPYADRLLKICKDKKHKVLTFSTKQDADFQATKIDVKQGKISIDVHFMGAAATNIILNLYGTFQVENILCAAAMAYATDVSIEEILKSIPKLSSVAGRMEFLGKTSKGAMIFIDYAHTPDAMENALSSIKHHGKGELYLVFGCGGDRDKEKRPQMGKIAVKNANHVYITDDNPRYENPDDIRSQILKGAPGAIDMADRACAIKDAMAKLNKGDILLIVGKGNQDGQLVQGKMLPYSDKEEVARWIQNRH